jgi:hypothetical protein
MVALENLRPGIKHCSPVTHFSSSPDPLVRIIYMKYPTSKRLKQAVVQIWGKKNILGKRELASSDFW